jgi:hypothetical protein
LRLTGEASSTIELVRPGGWVLRIPAVFDAGAVRKLLSLLDDRNKPCAKVKTPPMQRSHSRSAILALHQHARSAPGQIEDWGCH